MSHPISPVDLPAIPPHTDKTFGKVHLDNEAHVVSDPYTVLGIPNDADEESIRAAYRDALIRVSPEADPERARKVREARDRLLLPEQLYAREFGTLYVPDPALWGLPVLAVSASSQQGLTTEARMLGQVILYAMFEEEVWNLGLADQVYALAESLQDNA